MVSLPRHLLDLAVLLFIVGFGLYSLFLWLDDIEKVGIAYRNVFIIFTITLRLFVVYIGVIYSYKIDNENKRAKEFDLRSMKDGWNRANAIRDLERELARCQQTLNFMRGLEEESTPSTPRMSGMHGEDEAPEQTSKRSSVVEGQPHSRKTLEMASLHGLNDSLSPKIHGEKVDQGPVSEANAQESV